MRMIMMRTVVMRMMVMRVMVMMVIRMNTWRICSTKSGAITAERSQSSFERRRNSHSWK